MAWSERESQAAVEAYFGLLKSDQAGETVNKAALYRELSKKHARRSPKAFERKFQNISAILYELHLPYCSGLKPLGNYQRLLKLLVLDHLDRSPLPAVEPHDILFSKLKDLEGRQIQIDSSGAGRFGLAVERELGVPPNSSKTPDFMGIELKTKRDKSLQTLFSRVPSRYVQVQDKKGLFERHHYLDTKRERRALYTSFSSSPDSLGFSLRVDGQVIEVRRQSDVVCEYDAELIEEALLSKHTQTVFLKISTSRKAGIEYCKVDAATYCKWPSIIRFLRLISKGDVYLDFTMSEKGSGVVKDHGFLWRMRSDALDRLYLHTESIDVG